MATEAVHDITEGDKIDLQGYIVYCRGAMG